MTEITRFDRVAAQWVRTHYPGSDPVLGTVGFEADIAMYVSDQWADFSVNWAEPMPSPDTWPGCPGLIVQSRELGSAGNFDYTGLMRELTDMVLEEDQDEEVTDG